MKIKTGTIARTIVLLLALINQVFAIMGKGTIPLTEDMIYQLCTAIATVGASLTAWWKNNSFSQNAIYADKSLAALKKGIVEDGEMEVE